MANNDPVLIPYVIQEGSFWYVAYKEKNPFVPEITVSAKGIANHMSEEINDGYDFGPDTYNPSVTSGVPLTQTSGIQESVKYANGREIKVLNGNYMCTVPPQITQNTKLIGESAYVVGADINLAGGTPAGVVLTLNFNDSDGFIISPSETTSIQVTIKNLFLYFPSTVTGQQYGFHVFKGSSENSIAWSITNSIIDNIWVQGGSLDYHSFRIEDATYNQIGSLYSIGGAAFSFVNTGSINSGNSTIGYLYGVCTYTSGTTTSNFFEINGRPSGTGEIDLLDIGFVQLNSPAGQSTALATFNSAAYFNYASQININTLDHELYSMTTTYTINFDQGESTYGINVNITGFLPSFISGNPATVFSLFGNPSYIPNIIVDELARPHQIRGTTGCIITTDPQASLLSGGVSSPPGIIKGNNGNVTPSISANPPVSATVYQNTNPYAIEIDLPVYASTSGTAGYVTVAKGSTDTPTAIGNQFVNGSTSSTSVDIVKLRVPAGWYYEFTASGVTFGTASVFAD